MSPHLTSATYTSEHIKGTLHQYFGYTEFRPLQEVAIHNILNQNDVFVVMSTGSGKSLCYQLPSLMTQRPTIVISPLIALMNDQVRALRAVGIKAVALHSQNEDPNHWRNILQNQYSLIYMSPERLKSCLDSIQQLNDTVGLTMFAVDESHCCSEWGHDFRTAYRELHVLRDTFPHTPIMALTATATVKVESDIIRLLRLNQPVIARTSFNRPNLTFAIKQSADNVQHDLTRDLFGTHSSIVYCLSQADTESVANYICVELKLHAAAYHAGLPDTVRQQVHNGFVNDDIQVVVATIAFGMGIDKPDIRKVIHYGMVKSIEAYVQQTGRAGRDGQPSECVMFYKPKDFATIAWLNKSDKEHVALHNNAMFNAVRQFVTSADCRRKQMLEYFGERYDVDNCGACDNCIRGKQSADVTADARIFCTCVDELNEKFGLTMYISVLTGTGMSKCIEKQHMFKRPLLQCRSHKGLQTRGTAYLKAFAQLLVNNDVLKTESVGNGPMKATIYKLTATGHRLVRDALFVLPAMAMNSEMIAVQTKAKRSDPLSNTTRYTSTFGTPESKGPASELEQQLMNTLTELRKQVANAVRPVALAPYMILTRQNLLMLVQYRPTTLNGLMQMPDIAAAKLQAYGQQFADCIKQFCASHRLQSDLPFVPAADSSPADDGDIDSMTPLPKLELGSPEKPAAVVRPAQQSGHAFKVSTNVTPSIYAPQLSEQDTMRRIIQARGTKRAVSNDESDTMQQFLDTLNPAQRALFQRANMTNDSFATIKSELGTHAVSHAQPSRSSPVARTVSVTPSDIESIRYKPAALFEFDSCKVTPAKLAVYRQLCTGMTPTDVAADRKIKISSVMTYVSDMILNGYDTTGMPALQVDCNVVRDVYNVLDKHYAGNEQQPPPLLRNIKSELNDNVTYEDIKLCVARYRVEMANRLEFEGNIDTADQMPAINVQPDSEVAKPTTTLKADHTFKRPKLADITNSQTSQPSLGHADDSADVSSDIGAAFDAVLAAIDAGSGTVDQIQTHVKRMDVAKLNAVLVDMQMQGIIYQFNTTFRRL